VSDPPQASGPPGSRSSETIPEHLVETTVFKIPRPLGRPGPEHVWHIRLEVVGGPMDGLQCRVEGDALRIGRSRENELSLHSDPLVSSRHARIVREGRNYWLEDLSSRNGTFLGAQRLTSRLPLGPGVTFSVGQTLLEFMPR